MTLRSSFRLALTLAALFVFGGAAYAQGPVIDASSTTSELEMSATVQTAVQLNLSTGAALTSCETFPTAPLNCARKHAEGRTA